MEDMSEFKIETGPSAGSVSRLTAYKVWLSDIRKAEYKKQEAIPDYVEVSGRKVSRVNIVASVVDKYEAEKFSSLTLDDGSAQLRLRVFSDSISKLKEIETGDIILTISRLRSFNNETYLLPEIIKKVSSKHALLRRLELILEHGKRGEREESQPEKIQQVQTGTAQAELSQTETEMKENITRSGEQETRINLKERLKISIEKLDEGEGVEMSQLQGKFEEKEQETISKLIEDLLSEGEAYEPRPGKIKLI